MRGMGRPGVRSDLIEKRLRNAIAIPADEEPAPVTRRMREELPVPVALAGHDPERVARAAESAWAPAYAWTVR